VRVGAEAGGLRINEFVARAIDANRIVGLQSVGDAGGGQKCNDDGDHNKQ